MLATFPHQMEPDGAVFGPHHYYLGVMLALFVCWLVYDDRRNREPWVVAGPVMLSLFAFAMTWPYYPAIGALGVIVTLTIASIAAVARPFWWHYGWRMRSALVVGLVMAWDDAISHSFGWPTPLDVLWLEVIYPFIA